jgi:hypothetical protein
VQQIGRRQAGALDDLQVGELTGEQRRNRSDLFLEVSQPLRPVSQRCNDRVDCFILDRLFGLAARSNLQFISSAPARSISAGRAAPLDLRILVAKRAIGTNGQAQSIGFHSGQSTSCPHPGQTAPLIVLTQVR